VLPILNRHNMTLLIEDPATVWHLGADRYREIAARYAALTPRREKLAIDLNIVERYQNVYPTKQQTGVELYQLVHQAASSFERVALYFESSLFSTDLGLLPSAAASVKRVERIGNKLVVESSGGVGVPWKGGAVVDGQRWPVTDGEVVWLPPGAHAVEPAEARPGMRVVQFVGTLRAARFVGAGVELSYTSQTRALAVLSASPRRIEIDGVEGAPVLAGGMTVVLPRGQHVVAIYP
jgi:hypothetical protein